MHLIRAIHVHSVAKEGRKCQQSNVYLLKDVPAKTGAELLTYIVYFIMAPKEEI